MTMRAKVTDTRPIILGVEGHCAWLTNDNENQGCNATLYFVWIQHLSCCSASTITSVWLPYMKSAMCILITNSLVDDEKNSPTFEFDIWNGWIDVYMIYIHNDTKIYIWNAYNKWNTFTRYLAVSLKFPPNIKKR